MQTKDALRRYAGTSPEFGTGPVAQVADQLVSRYRAAEDHRRTEAADRSDALRLGPFTAAANARRQAATQAAFNDPRVPLLPKFDAARVVHQARRESGEDRSLRRLSGIVEHAYRGDPQGAFTTGEVSNMRDVLGREFGERCGAVRVIAQAFPRVSFETLPTGKLTAIAGRIRESANPQAAYDAAVTQHGLGGDDHSSMRARTFIRAAVESGVLDVAQAEAPSFGVSAAQRVYAHLQSRRAQFGDAPEGGPLGVEPGMDEFNLDDALPPLDGEGEYPHDEGEEVMDSFTSPNSGEELVMELAPVDTEFGEEMGEEFDAPGEEFGLEDGAIAPDRVARTLVFGQLDEFGENADAAEFEEDDEFDDLAMGPVDDAPQFLQIEDPSAPGQMLDVTVAPAGGEFGDDEYGSDGAPLPSDLTGITARRYAVYAVQHGVPAAEPVHRIRACTMQAALGLLARQVGPALVDRAQVLSDSPRAFQHQALVTIDADQGNFFLVRAEQTGDDAMSPDIVNGQPLVHHNVKVPEDGGDALTTFSPMRQSPSKGPKQAARVLGRAEVQDICARLGHTAVNVENAVLDGETVQAGAGAERWSIAADLAQGDIVVSTKQRGVIQRAALAQLDQAVHYWMARVASAVARHEPAPAGPDIEVRPLFQLGCQACGAVSEYAMPDKRTNLRCAEAHCGYVHTADAVGAQLQQRTAQLTQAGVDPSAFFSGYVVTTDIPIPNGIEYLNINAERMLRAVQQVAPQTAGGPIPGDTRMEMVVRAADRATLARIQRVLEDQFGARTIQAQPAPIEDTGAVNSMGQQLQHVDPGAQQMVQNVDMGAAPGGPPMGAVPTMQPTQPAMPSQQDIAPGVHRISYFDPVTRVADSMEVHAASFQSAVHIVQGALGQHIQIAAQLDMGSADMAPMDTGEAPMGPPPGDMGGETDPGGNMNLTAEDRGRVDTAISYYRETQLGPLTAAQRFTSEFGGMLDAYGPDEDPRRHLAEAEVIGLIHDAYSRAVVLAGRDGQPRTYPRASYDERLALRKMIAARLRKAQKLQTPSANTQQPDAVSGLGGGGAVLGSDTSGDEPPVFDVAVHTQTGKPHGTGGMSDTSLGPDSSGRDPGDFGAGKPPANGHVSTPGTGQKMSDTDMAIGDASSHGKHKWPKAK